MSPPPFGGWPPVVVPVTSVFGREGDVVAEDGDYNSSQVSNASGVAGATVTDALNNLLGGIGALTSSMIANASGVAGATVTAALNTLGAAIVALTSSSIANASGVAGATVTAALNTLGAAIAALTSSSIVNASGVAGATVTAALNTLSAVIGALTSTSIANASSVSGTTVSDALDTLLSETVALTEIKAARDPIWDRPTVPGPNDEEFDTDVLAGGTWSIALAASLGTPMTRDGDISLTTAVASGHYRSGVRGSTLYLQLRQNEEIMMWKTIAAAQSGHLVWFMGGGFQNEIGTSNTVDPRFSIQWCNNNAGVPSFADRAFVRTNTSSEAYQMITVTGGATVSNVATNAFTLLPLEGLALRINHGSAAAGNVGAYCIRKNGTIGTVLNGGGQQFNGANSKLAFNLQANTAQPPVSGVNNALFAFHFVRSIDLAANQWIAQN